MAVIDFFIYLCSFISNHPFVGLFLIILCCAGIIVLVLFPEGLPGPNPFTQDTTKPISPLILDQSARDKVLKQGFAQKHVPEKLDTIVIGSGGGGLATANILARAGQRVLVLEQHDQAGGCMHTFKENGYEFDVGIHYIGGMRHNTMLRHLTDQLTEGQLQWCDMDYEMDVVYLGKPHEHKRFPLLSSGKKRKENLKQLFPGEEHAIDKFFKMFTEVEKGMVGFMALKILPKWLVLILIRTGLVHLITKYFSYSHRSLKEVVDELTDNKELKAVLMYCFGDYGTLPETACFAVHAMLFRHFLEGGSYPLGGASEFAFHMIPPIERAGGKVLVRAPVSCILTDKDGAAVGVRVRKTSGDIDIFAKNIVSAAGVYNTFKELLPKDIGCQSDIYHLLDNQVHHGWAALSLFVGLRESSEKLGLRGQNIWAFTDVDLNKVTKEFLNSSAEDAVSGDIPLLFISFPSAKDPSYSQRYPGKSVCVVVTLANWNWFNLWENERVKNRGPAYEQIKKAFMERMWQQVLGFYPQLKDKVEYMEMGTPVSNKYYIGSPHGEIYGTDHDTTRFGSPETTMMLRPQTGIPGLYLSGQDILTCGYASAIISAVQTAGAILHRNCFWDLGSLKRKIGNKWEDKKIH